MKENGRTVASGRTLRIEALKKYWPVIRLLVLAAIIVSFYVIANEAGVLTRLDAESIRSSISQLGYLGILAYFILFSVGQLMHVPGLVFISAAALAFGDKQGLIVAMTGAAIAISLSFFVVRFIGGTPLGNPKGRFLQRGIERLDRQPVRTIFLLRLAFSTGPWLNYILAMTKVNYWQYIGASILGILPQVALTVYVVAQLIA